MNKKYINTSNKAVISNEFTKDISRVQHVVQEHEKLSLKINVNKS